MNLQDILNKHAEDLADFRQSFYLDPESEFYEDLFVFYMESRQMPYGVAKGRDEDPLVWIRNRLTGELVAH